MSKFPNVQVVVKNIFIYSYTPYDSRFIDFCHKNKGTWDPVSKCWFWGVASGIEPKLRAALKDIYGTDGIELVQQKCEEVKIKKVTSRAALLEID